MNAPRAAPEDYVQFLIASPRVVSAVKAGRVQPIRPNAPGHDAFTRLLADREPDPAALWGRGPTPRSRGPAGCSCWMTSTLDKPYAREMALVGRHWSGKHKDVVRGINLLTLLWTDGDALWPCDFRLLTPKPKAEEIEKASEPKPGSRAEGDQERPLPRHARRRQGPWTGSTPGAVRLMVLLPGEPQGRARSRLALPHSGQVQPAGRSRSDGQSADLGGEHLGGGNLDPPSRASAWSKAFRIVSTNGDAEHWITNDLGMDEAGRLAGSELAWGIEDYHRGLKQFTGVERCQARRENSQRNHIGFAIRAFVRLEWLPLLDRPGLVRGQMAGHPHGRPGLPRQPHLHPPQEGNCVTPISYLKGDSARPVSYLHLLITFAKRRRP